MTCESDESQIDTMDAVFIVKLFRSCVTLHVWILDVHNDTSHDA